MGYRQLRLHTDFPSLVEPAGAKPVILELDLKSARRNLPGIYAECL
jgi:hypothetical protein